MADYKHSMPVRSVTNTHPPGSKGERCCPLERGDLKEGERSDSHSAGGDLAGCLDASDIDACLAALQVEEGLQRRGMTVLSAQRFFEARTSEDPERRLADLGQGIQELMSEGKRVWVPAHIRHHWLTIECSREETTNDAGVVRIRVYDSAPSHPVQRDLARYVGAMFPHACIVHSKLFPKQIRGTNECGLFVIRAIQEAASNGEVARGDGGTESLAEWRNDLQRLVPVRVRGHQGPKAMREVRWTHNPYAPVLEIPAGGAGRRGLAADDGIDVDRFDAYSVEERDALPLSVREIESAVDISQEPMRSWLRGAMEDEERERAKQAVCPGPLNRQDFFLFLKKAPAKVRKAACFRALCKLAEEKLQKVKKEMEQGAIKEVFEGKHRGAFVSTVILRAVINAIPDAAQLKWTVLDLHGFRSYHELAREQAIPAVIKENVAVILWAQNHYILAVAQADPSQGGVMNIRVFDSLRSGEALVPPWDALLESFVTLLRSRGRKVSGQIVLENCPKQKTNECAIEAINNLSLVLCGARGHMSRQLIASVADSVAEGAPSMEEVLRHPLWARAWPNKGIEGALTSGQRHTGKDATVCCYHMQGRCAHGSVCWYSHNDQGQPCQYGSRCSLGHQKRTHAPNQPTAGVVPVIVDSRETPGAQTRGVPEETEGEQLGSPAGTAGVRSVVVHKPSGYRIGQILQTMAGGELIMIRWKWEQESGKWMVRLDKGKRSIQEVADWCPWCNAWHHFEDKDHPDAEPLPPQHYRFPDAEIVYDTIVFRAADPRIDPRSECIGEIEGMVKDELEQDADEVGSDCDDEERALMEVDKPVSEHDLKPLRDAIMQTPRSTLTSERVATGAWIRGVCIYDTKPGHINQLTYARLDETTHKSNRRWLRRLQEMVLTEDKLRDIQLPNLVIECIARHAERVKFSWATISSSLSQSVSALRLATLYTSASAGLDLKLDPIIMEAQKYAGRMARVAALDRRKDPGLTEEQYRSVLRRLKNPMAQLFLQLTWRFAARVGDLRRVLKKFCIVEDLTPEEITALGAEGYSKIKITFTSGKGFTFWGPYTLVAVLPKEEVKRLVEHLRQLKGEEPLFTKEIQSLIAAAIKGIRSPTDEGLLTLRSIRRGRLIELSQNDVSERELMLLSGHRKKATLAEYLGLGERLGLKEADTAAVSRERKWLLQQTLLQGDTIDEFASRMERERSSAGGGTDRSWEKTGMRPMAVTSWSGYASQKGRRKQRKVPELFESKPPSRRLLGIEKDHGEDPHKWPMHIKDVGFINFPKLLSMVRDARLREQLQKAREFILNPNHYGVNWAPMSKYEIPSTRISHEQIDELVSKGKLIPYEGIIRSSCRAFLVLEENKKRWRPIFEPLINISCVMDDDIVKLKYPSRHERRQLLGSQKWFHEFDFSAFFDQFELDASVLPYFVIRKGDNCYAVTRMPMGATFSPLLAQLVTHALLEPIITGERFARIKLSTMLDNVGFGGSIRRSFNEAIDMFLQRCGEVNATLKEPPQVGDDHCRYSSDSFVHLGEEYLHIVREGEPLGQGRIRNRPENVQKLREAMSRLKRGITPEDVTLERRLVHLTEEAPSLPRITARQYLGVMSLIVWLAHTIYLPLRNEFKLLQLYSKVARIGAADYDAPVPVQGSDVLYLDQACARIFVNEFVEIQRYLETSYDACDYHLVAMIDASKLGWSAIVELADATPDGVCIEIHKGFLREVRDSALAEPQAACELTEFLAGLGRHRMRAAYITDHSAIVTGQRKPKTGNGGFSAGWWLNELYRAAYAVFDSPEFFHVEGVKNLTDRGSRSVRLGQPLTVVERERVCFDLRNFMHPSESTREWWQV